MAKKTQSEGEHISVEYMAKDDFQTLCRARTLEDTCPILADFLKPGKASILYSSSVVTQRLTLYS